MDKIKCTQYACLNNTGLSNSKIHYGGDGLCILDNPRRINFKATKTWGCEDERYGNEVNSEKIRKIVCPKCASFDILVPLEFDWLCNTCNHGFDDEEAEYKEIDK